MIVLDETKTIAIWYAPLNKELNFMGCLQHPDDPEKDRDGNPRQPGGYDFNYRFRYYKDDMVFHSYDEKHWYHVEIHAMPQEEVLGKIRLLTHTLARMGDNAQLDEVINTGDWKKFFEEFSSKSWAHMQIEKEAHA